MWLMRLATIFKLVGRNGLLLLFALRHPLTPRTIKIGIFALLAYTISPIDLLPDFAAIFGWADDFALLAVGIPFLTKRLPVEVQQEAAAKVERLLSRFGMGGGGGTDAATAPTPTESDAPNSRN